MAIGETLQFTATVRDQNGQPVTDAVVSWQSSDDNVATISAEGLVTAAGNGTATITARSGNVSQSVAVKVHVKGSDEDREALAALYHSTNGPNWANNTNWLSDAPLDTWHGIGTNAHGEVQDLILGDNNLKGIISPEIGQLQNLTVLWLDGNKLSGNIPTEIGQLKNLTNLHLYGNQLSGPLPPEIGQLQNLRELWLVDNQLSGPLPPEIGQLQKLTGLWLSANELSGAIPLEIGQLQNLTELWLDGNQLSGPIPPEIVQLQKLTGLGLDGNQLSGNIPTEIGQLQNLTVLLLAANQLSGPVPPELGQLKNLTQLWLNANALSGPIPPEFGRLQKLTVLKLDHNALTGSIPPEIGQLRELSTLMLHQNQLSGTIPPEIGKLGMLRILHVAFNPGLTGALPESFATHSNIEFLSLHYTQVCVPSTDQFQSWLDGIEDIRGDINDCSEPEGPEEPEEPETPPPVGERLAIRIVYFIPANHNGYPNIDARIDSLINIVQLTYAEIMEFHGFGDRTFRYEQNEDGTARVYHVRGRYDGEYYASDTWGRVDDELSRIFDMESNIYLVVVDSYDATIDGNCGVGWGARPESGAALIPGPNDFWFEDRGWSCFNPSVTAHEIGHTFGLLHDLLRDEVRAESSYQDDWMITSYGAAEWMSVLPYFTGEPTIGDDNEGEISLRSISDVGTDTIRLVFLVSDPDMLHQAQLQDKNGDLIAYRGLEGEVATVVIETDQVSYGDWIRLRIIDKRAYRVGLEFNVDRDGFTSTEQSRTGRFFEPQN